MNEISCLKVRMAIDTNVTAPVNITGAPVTNIVANHAQKPEKFNRQNFKRWQQKMFFYLTTLNLARFLNETAPQVEPPKEGKASNQQVVQAVKAWKHSDFLCHNYILNGLVDSLYNVYCKTTTTKELWESLERKYKTEDAGTKKFVVARACFLDYKMVDSKNVITQVQDLQKNTYAPDSAKANMVEHVGSSLKSNFKAKGKGKKKNDKKGKGKAEYLAPKVGIVKQKFQDKDEAIDKFVLYKIEVENKLGKKIKDVRSDRGGEYVSPFDELCMKHRIRHEFTAPYLPQQNSIAERKNCTLKEMVNDMFISSGLSQDIQGSCAKSQKIKPKFVDCIFIGYAKDSNAYRFIVHDLKNPDIQKNAVMQSRNVSFFENIFSCLMKDTGSSSRLDDEVVQDKRQQGDNDLQDERQDQPEEEGVEQRKSKRERTEKSFGPDFVSFMVENEPTSYQEAELVDLPPGCKPLGYKWIFKKKMKADGNIDKFKARLVIKGFRKREGLDYFDTYSPVMRITSIGMILSIAVLRNLEVHQIDVKHTSSGHVMLCLYVDDMLIIGSNEKMIKSTKDMLKSKFNMKDMGLAVVILRIKILSNQNGLVTRPDLAYAISRLSRYTSNPSDAHWKAMTRVLHYLRYNHDFGLHYDRYPAVIEGYNDTNWISDIKDSKSTSGYVFTLGGPAIS
ncbi:retrovirus-related pol polyprotein from transposon TNT 1-94 [Tanacetum coccineum]